MAGAAFWGASSGVWGGDVPAWPSLSVPLQEVSVEALLQATGLPAELVHQALAPLTRDGILVQSCTQGGECGAGHPWGNAGLAPYGARWGSGSLGCK